jgi:hypothetical protein
MRIHAPVVDEYDTRSELKWTCRFHSDTISCTKGEQKPRSFPIVSTRQVRKANRITLYENEVSRHKPTCYKPACMCRSTSPETQHLPIIASYRAEAVKPHLSGGVDFQNAANRGEEAGNEADCVSPLLEQCHSPLNFIVVLLCCRFESSLTTNAHSAALVWGEQVTKRCRSARTNLNRPCSPELPLRYES